MAFSLQNVDIQRKGEWQKKENIDDRKKKTNVTVKKTTKD
jgi:hypothetical protein